MNKPITIKYQELKNELASIINNSELPMFIIESVLREYLMEARNYAEQQYLKDLSMYRKYINEKEATNNADVEKMLEEGV